MILCISFRIGAVRVSLRVTVGVSENDKVRVRVSGTNRDNVGV